MTLTPLAPCAIERYMLTRCYCSYTKQPPLNTMTTQWQCSFIWTDESTLDCHVLQMRRDDVAVWAFSLVLSMHDQPTRYGMSDACSTHLTRRRRRPALSTSASDAYPDRA